MFKNIGFILSLFLMSSAAVWGQATSDVYYQWGNKLYVQGNYDLCIKYYKAAIQVDPQNWKAYQALGSCEYHLGQKDQSIQDFNQSLALNPNNPPLQNFVNQIQGSSVTSTPASSLSYHPTPTNFVDNRLPRPGSLSFFLGSAASSYGYGDLVNDYAPETLTAPSDTPIGAEFDFGADYTLSPNFQLGAQVQFDAKEPETLTSTTSYEEYGYVYTSTTTVIYDENFVGGAVIGKYLLPLSDQFRLILEGQAGYYTLVGTTITGSSSSSVANVSGSAPGGLIGAELEWILGNGGWGLDFGLGYRVLTFSSLTGSASGYSSSSSSQTLQNGNGQNATFDFSGLRFLVGVRFF